MKCLILGAGPAGCSVAYFLKKRGVTDITMVEKDDRIGGCSKTYFHDNIPYEFGPQIMYTDEEKIKSVYLEFLIQNPPKTDDGEYHPALSVDGKLDDPHTFPVTVKNVLKLKNPEKAIFELYNVNLQKPDYTNLENYVVSRMGKTLYETYVKNYNIKQWKRNPIDMDTEWVKYRNLSLREIPDLFQGKWQGHPGDYTNLWNGMTKDIKIIKGEATIDDKFNEVKIDGCLTDNYDLIISTLPLSRKIEFINTYAVYVSLKSEEIIMPGYATSFPNNYDFVRILEYRQQFYVENEHTLLSFEFPWVDICEKEKYHSQVKWFCENILKKKIEQEYVISKEKTYPVPTKKNLDLAKKQLQLASKTNIIPIGRNGVHAYISKDTCIRMASILGDNLEILCSDDLIAKRLIFRKMREKLS